VARCLAYVQGARHRLGHECRIGGSGHGFKFGGSIGPVIADALEERADALGDLFRLRGRFADPGPRS
jgi:hypothetical protein